MHYHCSRRIFFERLSGIDANELIEMPFKIKRHSKEDKCFYKFVDSIFYKLVEFYVQTNQWPSACGRGRS